MRQKPAMFGYTGPNASSSHGNETNASVTNAPATASFFSSGKTTARKATMPIGNTIKQR